MASRRVFQANGWTPTAVADTTNFTDGGYVAIGANNANTGLMISEIRLSGQAAASAVNEMLFARDSTLGGTLTALASPNSDGPMNGIGGAAAALTFVASTTKPQRAAAATSARLNLSFNAFGGQQVWQAMPGGEWYIIGITASVSESSLSTPTSSPGRMGSQIIYEPF